MVLFSWQVLAPVSFSRSLLFAVLFTDMEIPQKVCKSCGYSYAEDAGRQHGTAFTCKQCRNILEVIRRNLKVKKSNAQLPQWKFENSKLALVPLKDLHGHEPMHLLREGSTGLCLLR